MNVSFDDYMADVYSQLECNMSCENKAQYVSYNYSEEDIKANIEYFKYCLKSNLSPYKALLFLSDHLVDNK